MYFLEEFGDWFEVVLGPGVIDRPGSEAVGIGAEADVKFLSYLPAQSAGDRIGSNRQVRPHVIFWTLRARSRFFRGSIFSHVLTLAELRVSGFTRVLDSWLTDFSHFIWSAQHSEEQKPGVHYVMAIRRWARLKQSLFFSFLLSRHHVRGTDPDSRESCPPIQLVWWCRAAEVSGIERLPLPLQQSFSEVLLGMKTIQCPVCFRPRSRRGLRRSIKPV